MGLPRPTLCQRVRDVQLREAAFPINKQPDIADCAVQHELAVDQNIHVEVLLFHLKLSFPFDDEAQAPEDVK